MRIGIDFDNTIACYDGVFHRAALRARPDPGRRCRRPRTACATSCAARAARTTGPSCRAMSTAPRMDLASAFPGVRDFLRAATRGGLRDRASSATRRAIPIAARNTTCTAPALRLADGAGLLRRRLARPRPRQGLSRADQARQARAHRQRSAATPSSTTCPSCSASRASRRPRSASCSTRTTPHPTLRATGACARGRRSPGLAAEGVMIAADLPQLQAHDVAALLDNAAFDDAVAHDAAGRRRQQPRLPHRVRRPARWCSSSYFHSADDPRDRLGAEFALTVLRLAQRRPQPAQAARRATSRAGSASTPSSTGCALRPARSTAPRSTRRWPSRWRWTGCATPRTRARCPTAPRRRSASATIWHWSSGASRSLGRIDVGDALQADAAQFVSQALMPAWDRLAERVRAEAARAGIAVDEELPPEERTISPSDFGFHNALRGRRRHDPLHRFRICRLGRSRQAGRATSSARSRCRCRASSTRASPTASPAARPRAGAAPQALRPAAAGLRRQMGLHHAQRLPAGRREAPPLRRRRRAGRAPRRPARQGARRAATALEVMMAKYVVIGSNSFSGQDFVDLLLDDPSREVIGCQRSAEKPDFCCATARTGTVGQFRFRQLDMNRDMPALLELLDAERPDYIVNFAAQSEVAPSWEHPEHWFQTNTVALAQLVNHLRRQDYLKRYLHISSPEAYGTCVGTVTRRRAADNPSTPYAASKAAADMLSRRLPASSSASRSLTVRATNVYGARQQLFKIIPRSVIYLKLGQQDPAARRRRGGEVLHPHPRRLARRARGPGRGRGRRAYHLSPDGGVAVRDVVRSICGRMGRKLRGRGRRSSPSVPARTRPTSSTRPRRAASSAGQPEIDARPGHRRESAAMGRARNWAAIAKQPLNYQPQGLRRHGLRRLHQPCPQIDEARLSERVTEHDKAAVARLAMQVRTATTGTASATTGYGGYRYDGRWRKVADAMVAALRPEARHAHPRRRLRQGLPALRLHRRSLPGVEVAGIDISAYAHRTRQGRGAAVPAGRQRRAACRSPTRRSISSSRINTLHNLYIYDL